jgi:eukaryotic-like serine/threonine-protein kinase
MTPEQWHRVKEVFEAALEYAPGERSVFLGRACGGDDLLRGEVNSLLSSYEQETGFMETPAGALAAQSLAKEESAALIGQKIGHYQIIREIGRGGMGVVYLAEDINLSRRPVALKLLPTHLTTDPERLRRFEREARAASALNHPNILTIHEIGERDSRHFIVTEFIDGVTLREQMRIKELKLSEALNIAAQIASALVAAHKAGIVHRDIKPENIMIRGDGYLKVLDFGLAKLTEHSPAVDTEAATRAMMNTNPGAVMGTAGYMSPEQARGLAVDARTDIWSLGVVLYEMVTKRVPFAGETPSHVIVSILEQEPPPLADYLPEAPARLQEIISKALCKNREERYQSINELLIDLKSLGQELGPDAEIGPVKWLKAGSGLASERTAKNVFSASRLRWLAAVLVLVVGGSLWFYRTRRTAALLPLMKVGPFTSFPGKKAHPAFSPDGNQIAFAWGGEKDENLQLYVKQVGSENPVRITFSSPDWDYSPNWSPDGQRIAFLRFSKGDRAIFTVSALGAAGSERKLLSLAPKAGADRIDWSPDGRSIATPDRNSKEEPRSIFLVSPETGEKRVLTSPPARSVGDADPTFSPDSQTLAFVRWDTLITSDLYLVPVIGGEPRRLTFDSMLISGLAWTLDGREIVFSSNRGGTPCLWRIPVFGGTPERLAVGGDNVGRSSIARQGHRLAYVQGFQSVNINRIEVAGATSLNNPPPTLIGSTRTQSGPQFSPDGKSIAFQTDRSGSPEIWMCDSEGLNPIRLTSFGGPEVGSPRWSPDGKQLAFDSHAKGHADIYVLSVEGGLPRRITSESSTDVLPSWSKDGRWIYFASNRSGNDQVWKVPVEGGGAVQVTKQGGIEPFESADGKFVYYCKGVHDPGLWRVPVEGGEETLVFNLKAGWGNWALMQDGIYFIDWVKTEAPWAFAIEFFSFATHRVTEVARLGKITIGYGFAASPDHRWILYTQVAPNNDEIMLVENFR